MAEIKKLQFSSGTDVTAPTDLTSASSTIRLATYANDAAYVTANGAAVEGSIYINDTDDTIHLYVDAAWRKCVMAGDPADPTKVFILDLAGATTGTSATLDFNQSANRVYTYPNYSGIVVQNVNTETDPTLLSGATGTTTIGNASGTVVFPGNIQVTGTTTQVDSTNLNVADKNILVNDGGNDASSEGAGLTVERTGTSGSIIYATAAATKFKLGALGAEVEIADISTAQAFTNKSIDGGTNTLTNIAFSSTTGTLAINRGGTGQTVANDALNALLPTQTSNSGKFLTTDGTNTSWATTGGGGTTSSPMDAMNYGFTTSVGASALTINLKTNAGSDATVGDPITYSFRSATAATGTYIARSVTSALSIVISSGATLGHVSAKDEYIYVYALDNAGTVELAVSTKRFNDARIQSTTAMSGSATSPTVLYSTVARTNVAIRLIGQMTSNQTTAGTYAAVPTRISTRTDAPFVSALGDMAFTTTGFSHDTKMIQATRLGNLLKVYGSFRIVTPTGSNCSFNLPTGYTLDTAKLSSTYDTPFGYWTRSFGGADVVYSNQHGLFYYDVSIGDSTKINLAQQQSGSQSGYYTPITGTGSLGNLDAMMFYFEVPITEFDI